MRDETDWDYYASMLAHFFPGLAAGVGGDPMDLPCERIMSACRNIPDVANYVNGAEKIEVQLERRFLDRIKEIAND